MYFLEVSFWTLLSLVFYTYLGYGIILFFFTFIKNRFASKNNNSYNEDLPTITLVIPAYNEINYLHQKVRNSLKLLYPKDKISIIFITDGSDDGSHLMLSSYSDIKIYHDPVRAGKVAAMNRSMSFVDSEVVIFSDANANLNEHALLNIAKKFSNPRVGCVSGEKRIQQNFKDQASNAGEGLYWKYESMLKKWSSELFSTVGAAGELYAIRTELYEETESDVILDDFMLSLSVIPKGYTIAYADDAYAIESGSSDIKEEMKRKVRICAGGIQSILRTIHLLNPFKYHIFAFQYFSHRFLRWTFTPLALLILIPLNLYLGIVLGGIYKTLLILQILFYLAGLGGWILKSKELKNKFLFIPFYFLMMNVSALLGAKRYFAGQQSVLWEKTKRL
ncbi:MAG: glycosyltransferase family 2 protein [Saprospiraceae bacterium]|nr:glycosyltransferase family 2 protein [Saprospiraceae bacterium]